MSWPGKHTPPFYVHDRTCTHCGTEFPGFSRQKYCSPQCIEMAKRATLMTRWGVPAEIVTELTRVGAAHG
jgi:hypothetical protein